MPVEAALKSLAKQNSNSIDPLQPLASNEKLCDLALKEIQNEGKKGGLTGIEIIDGIVLAKEEWTPQNVSLLNKYRLWNMLMSMTGPRHQRAESQPQSYFAAV